MSDSAFPDSHCAVDSKDTGHPVEELLLSGLEISASLFHLGQYCNQWESSLHGHQRAGFHVVLHGPCWLHIQHQDALALQAGDAVFFHARYVSPGWSRTKTRLAQIDTHIFYR